VAQLPPAAEDSLLLLFEQRRQSALLAESALEWRGTTVFARYERARKDELFPPPDLRHSTPYSIGKLDVGILVERPTAWGVRLGAGATAGVHWVPAELVPAYGANPKSLMLFTRLGF
jgi:hypothetical protein